MSTLVTASERHAKVRRRFNGLSPEERQEQRRKRLVEAGLEAFGTLGFHAVGIREICAEAELTERYFYESFANREALFLAVYEHAERRVRNAIEVAIGAAKFEISTVARVALGALLETLKGEPRLARVLFVDALTVGVDVGRQSILATQGFAELAVSIVRRAYPNLPKQRVDAQLIAQGLVGSTLHIVMQWALNGFREPIEHVLDHAVMFYDAVAHQVLNEDEPPPRSAARAPQSKKFGKTNSRSKSGAKR